MTISPEPAAATRSRFRAGSSVPQRDRGQFLSTVRRLAAPGDNRRTNRQPGLILPARQGRQDARPAVERILASPPGNLLATEERAPTRAAGAGTDQIAPERPDKFSRTSRTVWTTPAPRRDEASPPQPEPRRLAQPARREEGT